MSYTIYRLPTVCNKLALSRSTLYLRIANGLWPKPISLGARSVGWLETEVDAMLAALVSQASSDEIKHLVKQLEANRKTKKPVTNTQLSLYETFPAENAAEAK